MKSFSPFFVLILLLKITPGFCQQEDLKIFPVSESIYLINGTGCNVVFLVTVEGILVIDSGEKPALTDVLLSKIREISALPIRYLIFTHYHHIVGADGFPESIIVLSHINTKSNIPLHRKITINLMEKHILDLKSRYISVEPKNDSIMKLICLRENQLNGMKNQREVLPEITFESSLSINLADQEVRLIYLGPGHTNGDIIVYFPDEKVICLGDLLFTNGWIPRLDGDAGSSVNNWLNIYEKIDTMDFQKIVPGHGEIICKEEFKSYSKIASEYLTDLRSEVKRYIEEGCSLEFIRSNLKLSKYNEIEMAKELLSWNIDGVYYEILNSKNR